MPVELSAFVPFALVCWVEGEFMYTMLWSEPALAGGGGCGTTFRPCTLGRWACRIRMYSMHLLSFGLEPLYVSDIPPLCVLKSVLEMVNLVANYIS